MSGTLTLDILDRLVGFDTVSARSNLSLVAFATAHLTDLGFRVTRLEDADGNKAGIYAELRPGPGGVLLSGHTDVVPVEGQRWTRDPFRLTAEGDRLYGRGTTDMKGFVAAMLSAAARAVAMPLVQPLKLVLSYDEEVGCIGMTRMIAPLAGLVGNPRFCVVGEPTEMAIARGHKGKVALRAVCRGQTGHSAMAPTFLNALHPAADLVTALRGLQDEITKNGARDPAYDIPYATIHVGQMRGGTALNIVPDRAELDLEIRHLAAEDADSLIARIKAAAATISARYRHDGTDAGIAFTTLSAYPGLDVPVTAPVIADLSALAETQRVIKVPFGTEAGFFNRLGIPTLVCGPGSMADQGHGPDEYITGTQLAACDAMLDRLLATLCRPAP